MAQGEKKRKVCCRLKVVQINISVEKSSKNGLSSSLSPPNVNKLSGRRCLCVSVSLAAKLATRKLQMAKNAN